MKLPLEDCLLYTVLALTVSEQRQRNRLLLAEKMLLEYLLTLGAESETAYEILIRSYLSAAREHGTLAPMYLKLTTGLRRGERLALQWENLDAP